MRFTEHELTEAVTHAAKTVAGMRREAYADAATPRRRGPRCRATSATRCSTPSAPRCCRCCSRSRTSRCRRAPRPTFTDAQVLAAVQETLGEAGRGLRGKVALAARVALVRDAVAAAAASAGVMDTAAG